MKSPDSSAARLDQKYLWHPFTQMRDWLKAKPIVIVDGKGAILRDNEGRKYLDANSSIWTNLHGHCHPRLNSALKKQLGRIAHSSALGLANVPAAQLGEKLITAANPPSVKLAGPPLQRVFFSDDGSTAMEAALKMAHQYTCRIRPGKKPLKFLSVGGAYHGDTIGAVSLGHIPIFHQAYRNLLFKTDQIRSPYCYRCPFNRAKPERADARDYRRCQQECTTQLEEKFSAQKKKGSPYAAFVFEPLMQGAAGMIAQPKGWLNHAAKLARAQGALLIADEVMTGFGRSGSLFACHQESVQPDLMALAKGLTGGYLPMAATLANQHLFDSFLGDYDEFKTFFHGHSYTGNQLGASVALASLQLLQTPGSIKSRQVLEQSLRRELQTLWNLPNVGDIRQVGLMAGVELVKHWKTRERFAAGARVGARVCEAMARRGVLTRPVGDVIVLMPPYCTTPAQARQIIRSLYEAVSEVTKSCVN